MKIWGWLKEATQSLDLTDDTFERKTKVHDWRNHVSEDIEAHWAELTDREKMLVAALADSEADDEVWD